MTLPIEFIVIGSPVPQAGMRAVSTAQGVRQITTGGTGLKDWRSAVAEAARNAAGDNAPIGHAVQVTVEFRFPMPKSRSKAQRLLGIIPRATKPDLDKLQRAVGDALTAGGLIQDDNLITSWHASKWEVVGWTGCSIEIDNLTDRSAQ